MVLFGVLLLGLFGALGAQSARDKKAGPPGARSAGGLAAQAPPPRVPWEPPVRPGGRDGGRREGGPEGASHAAGMIFDGRGALPPSPAVAASPPGPSAGERPDGYPATMRRLALLAASKRHASISTGSPGDGGLKHAMELPPEGFGYRCVHPGRKRNFGADELVLGLVRLAADLQSLHPGRPGLAIGDLSRKDGGEVSGHQSHENGRDVDIIFLASDRAGNPVPQDRFLDFDAKGRRGNLRFDTARNWDLVVLMLTNPYWSDRVEVIFIDASLRSLLLSHAKGLAAAAAGEERGRLEALIRLAKRRLVHYRNHANHFHLRIRSKRGGGSALA